MKSFLIASSLAEFPGGTVLQFLFLLSHFVNVI